MSRRDASTDAPGHDSFLDIVANMVGILIILVIVVGMRVKNVPVVAAIPTGFVKEKAAFDRERAVERSLHNDVLAVAEKAKELEEQTLVRTARRNALATLAAAAERQLERRREEMDTEARVDFDLERNLADARLQLEQLDRQRVQAETTQAAPIKTEAFPTPLSRTVDANEGHFQLLGGLIAYVPLNTLVDDLQNELERKAYKLRDVPELSGTLGPVDGFRVRYTFQRRMITGGGYTGYRLQLKRMVLVPVAEKLGEPLDLALQEGSMFRRALAKLHPGRHTVTIWVYPDSFDEFRTVQKELYQMGFAVAARPLAHGTPISGSPHGTKSAAQ